MNVNNNTVPVVPQPKHSPLEQQIATLHEALKGMKTKDLTDAQYELLCVLDNEFSDRD